MLICDVDACTLESSLQRTCHGLGVPHALNSVDGGGRELVEVAASGGLCAVLWSMGVPGGC